MREPCRGLLVALLLTISFATALPAQSGPADGSRPGEFLTLPNAKLFYQECGSSPETVVLLHDGVLDSAVWDDVWPELCQKFHVVRYDRRGYGRSPASPEPYFESDDLAALLRHLKLERAAIVGSSHGGEISINFALAHPQMVEQLVLVGAVVGGMPYSAHFLERGEVIDKLLEKGDVAGAIAAARDDRYLIAPGNQAARNRMAALLTSSPQDLTHPSREIAPKPALPDLHEIKSPTLLLVGEADIPDVHAHAGAIEAGIPRARRIVVSGVGHLMYLEKPKEFSELLSRFIEQNR